MLSGCEDKELLETITRKAPQITSSTEIGRRVIGANAWSFAAVAVLAAFYLVSSLYIASHRLFWYDEIFTARIAWLPHWRTIWAALNQAVDPQPPFYDLVVRISGKLFGHSEVAARLPSSLAMVAGLLVTFDCTRRLTDGLHGLIALSALTCSILLYFGYEARPYAICFLLSALALWIWTTTRTDSKWGAVFFGVVFALGVNIHYYFTLCLVPYALWEVIRWRPWQLPSAKLVAGVVGVVVPAPLLYPLMLSLAHESARSFWARPSLYALEDVFSRLFPLGFFLLPLIVIWIVVAGINYKSTVLPPMPSGESLGWLFLCIPLAGFALAEWKTGAFFPRYFIGALPGIGVAFSCWLWRHFRGYGLVPMGVFLLLMSAGAVRQLSVVRNPDDPSEQSGITRQYLDLEESLNGEGKRLMLFSRPLLYLQADYYSKHPDQCILLLPPGFDREPGYQAQRALVHLSRYSPLQFGLPPYDLGERAHDAVLIQPTPEVLDGLKKAGFRVHLRSSRPFEVYDLQ